MTRETRKAILGAILIFAISFVVWLILAARGAQLILREETLEGGILERHDKFGAASWSSRPCNTASAPSALSLRMLHQMGDQSCPRLQGASVADATLKSSKRIGVVA